MNSNMLIIIVLNTYIHKPIEPVTITNGRGILTNINASEFNELPIEDNITINALPITLKKIHINLISIRVTCGSGNKNNFIVKQ